MTEHRAPLPAEDLRHILDHSRDVLTACAGARLFLTGVTGLIGSWLLESALDANRELRLGLEITVLVRDPMAFAARFPHLATAPGLRLALGDVRDFTAPTGAFSHIVHCASAASPAMVAERPDEVVRIIEDGTRRVLDLARAGNGVRFLQMSSGSVYGPQPASIARLDEAYPGSADESVSTAQRFGAAKRRAEAMGEDATADGVQVVSARTFALVGPRLPLDRQFALGNFLGDALGGRTITLTSDGTAERSWLHMADLTAWCWTLLVRGAAGRAYNVGSEEAFSLWDAAHRVARLAEPPVGVQRASEPSLGQAPQRYIPSIARARAELGLDAWIPFDEAIRRTWGWLRTLPA